MDKQNFSAPEIPVYANSTGNPYSANISEVKSTLKGQILNPVLFKNQIENIYGAGGRIFVEFGPKGTLTNLVRNILDGRDHHVIAVNASAKKDSDLLFRQAVLQMQVLGLSLSNIDPYKREITALPPKSKLTVQLSGNNYVSQGTQKAHQDLMSDGFQISGGTKVVEKLSPSKRESKCPFKVLLLVNPKMKKKS